ncbi:MAG TPA: ABC transporter ATP-binding protein [Rhabdochlamydiaceae bacterium]|nr:ABC transporter ATP-binding protein [Rhabdochlamydiaceae bacterium]
MPYKNLGAFFWHFIRPYRWTFFFIFLVSIVWALDATVWPYILRLVVDIFTMNETHRAAAWPALLTPIYMGIALWITIEYGFRAQGYLQMRAMPRLEADIRMAMFDHIQRHSPKYFNARFAGSLTNKISDMTTQVSLILQQLLTMFMPALAACILATLFAFRINPLFAVIFIAWITLHFCICLLYTKKVSKLEHLHSEIRSSLLGRIVDSLTNNFAVNLFYRFSHEKAFVGALQKEEQHAHYLSRKYMEKMRLSLGFFFMLSGICIYGLMFYFWFQDKITTGEAVQLFNTQWNIGMMIWLTGSAIPQLFQSISTAKQALVLMNDPQDLLDLPTANPLHVSKGEIQFDNVTFHYGEKKLFQNKNVHIHGGEKVGLVGYSGAGKSTFVSLILRLFPVESGKIFIDGQDIAQVTLESLRSQVALIPQDPVLFHRSLKENIGFGKLNGKEDEIFIAAKLAHCDEFIRKIPTGYETLVGERGTKLSGGERQRIAIARALLTDAPIIIFDEATSSLDSITEKYIQDSLETLMQNRTTIVIAHRLSTLSKMDRILVFDHGKIIEEGSHAQLLSLNGHYAKMWKTQAGGFLPEKPMNLI